MLYFIADDDICYMLYRAQPSKEAGNNCISKHCNIKYVQCLKFFKHNLMFGWIVLHCIEIEPYICCLSYHVDLKNVKP